jgi:hypothetical protein
MIGLFFTIALATVAAGQTPQPDLKATANPDLVGQLSKELGSTPKQAEGAAGALFGLAKSRLQPADWAKVAGAVPGMDGLLSAAPALAAGTAGGAVGALTSAAGGAGGLASAASAFSQLKLKPELVAKAVPIVTNYVTKSGGAQIGQLLAGVLK